MTIAIAHAKSLINHYINAKDNNKPYLMQCAFLESAVLEMNVNTQAIHFPPETEGRKNITQLLVRDFNQQYENVFTFCIEDSIVIKDNILSCQWLVGMTDKQSGEIKVGCGLYDWAFKEKVERFTITLDYMDILSSQHTLAVFNWLCSLSYPWVSKNTVLTTTPAIKMLDPVKAYFNH